MSENLSSVLCSGEYYSYAIIFGGNSFKPIYSYNNNEIIITIINKKYGMLLLKYNVTDKFANTNIIKDLVNEYTKADNLFVYYISFPQIYNLLETSAVKASQVDSVQTGLPLHLTGDKVNIAIIDTGIDYLNEEFYDDDGNTRINAIWDQTIEDGTNEECLVSFGSVYLKDKINKAIEAKRNGENPYDIVPTKDTNGHGTHMAGIVGANGKNPELKGMAPNCEYLIIKLAEEISFLKNSQSEFVFFSLPIIISAIQFAYEYKINTNKPTIVLLPIGSNSGNHKGRSMLGEYIQSISETIGFAIVSGSGNQGIADCHVSGEITDLGDNQTIELIVGQGQKQLSIELWCNLPNIIDVELISPSGETTGVIPALLDSNKEYLFTLERTLISTYYDIPDIFSGDELIRIYMKSVQEGIWRIRVTLKLGRDATYNGWLCQKELLVNGTRFTPSDPYGTITTPGDSTIVITAAAYNQNNYNLLAYSGVSFREQYINNIDFATGGVNTKTVGLDNNVAIVNGTSLSAAVGAGACALLFEWGIVNGNYQYMYALSLKTFLSRGTIERAGDMYPNPQWGYGILNIYKIFENMQ